ncbi:hypothetical protein SLEP1_g41990 [Rubroshorea leprosula]|uniref:Uncharacterized protein n=1 Tax=Rubroshorea leprosula TaxID=152421 RepID=A0AAV5L8A8_9ROSI|nr:hypothetical protein SLEP1_g41990 [Rubroshorea leprosula]
MDSSEDREAAHSTVGLMRGIWWSMGRILPEQLLDIIKPRVTLEHLYLNVICWNFDLMFNWVHNLLYKYWRT